MKIIDLKNVNLIIINYHSFNRMTVWVTMWVTMWVTVSSWQSNQVSDNNNVKQDVMMHCDA